MISKAHFIAFYIGKWAKRERTYKANKKEGVRENIKMLVYRDNKSIKRNCLSQISFLMCME
jgi:hypothetical protein